VSRADSEPPRVAVIATGVANLASMLAALARAGAAAFASRDPEAVADAQFAVLPGVGAFGPAAASLRAGGLDASLRERWRAGAPTMGVCLGMQLFFEGSEESPGEKGLGLLPGTIGRFAGGLPLPQLGWNRITPDLPEAGDPLVAGGWAYFANSYRLSDPPPSCIAHRASYGETFVAALEAGFSVSAAGRPALLLCQFHPELSGGWGQGILARWLGTGQGAAP